MSLSGGQLLESGCGVVDKIGVGWPAQAWLGHLQCPLL